MRMSFIPDTPKDSKQVPYYENASKEDGWKGQATDKSIATLKSEITMSISRLGATVISFQSGTFEGAQGSRDGFQVKYSVESVDGRLIYGRIDIAALPVDPNINWHRADKDKHKDASIRMALFMLRDALDGTWFLQQLSPGYSALVPFMLGPGDRTVSELWTDGLMSRLLPPGNPEEFTVIEGEIVNEKDC